MPDAHDNGPCPYLPDRRWKTEAVLVHRLEPGIHEKLLGTGWRRSGHVLYRNTCPGCRECVPIRVPVERFTPSRSQRRVLKRNMDLTVELSEPHATEEIYRLYRRYENSRHNPDRATAPEHFAEFLVNTPTESRMLVCRHRSRIVAVSWIDLLPGGVSSVYCVFEPTEPHRSLGTFTALQEIRLCKATHAPYYYIGFYVRDCHKMNYKARFRPYQLLINHEWCDVPDTQSGQMPS
jgi:leucyl-tRNA---protein transferase